MTGLQVWLTRMPRQSGSICSGTLQHGHLTKSHKGPVLQIICDTLYQVCRLQYCLKQFAYAVMSSILKVMISSTARDLPEQRQQVMDACLRQGMFPSMMEHLFASGAETTTASLKLVDDADIYVGLLAHRYGYIPMANNPEQISITEMEYNRAVERKIPRMIFVMDKTHPVTIEDVETGESAAKLAKFRGRVQTENIVNFFKSPLDLRAKVIHSLSQHRTSDPTAFHHVSDIPVAPEPYIAHPYTLLQTHRLVGRQMELNLLNDWVTKREDEIYSARILSIVAIGGMGKSALAWKWFNDIAPREMKPLVGRMWWSFYETDASFENFISRALAYVGGRPLGEVQEIPKPEREAQLLAVLNREAFLIVLDGLERILIAYALMDAAHLTDDEYDKQTANFVANAYGLPTSAKQLFPGEHHLRRTVDPRAGFFLRKLAGVKVARTLVSTRLYPADLQTPTGDSSPGCAAILLHGLADDDALELWRAFGLTGGRELLPLFNRVDNHPLVIQSLASEVARYRAAPGDFERWRDDHPEFDPFKLRLVNVKSHVLEFALRGLEDRVWQALPTIAAFRMPARYDTLTALLIGKRKALVDESALDSALTELEDRGLLSWDRRTNRYDMHPVVRGEVLRRLNEVARRDIYGTLQAHFETQPSIEWREVNSFQDLTSVIELYNTLIVLERYDDAFQLFTERLKDVAFFRLGANHQTSELLKMLFPDGVEELPRLSQRRAQADALAALAEAYTDIGRQLEARSLLCRSNDLYEQGGDLLILGSGLGLLGLVLNTTGNLLESETSILKGLIINRSQRDEISEGKNLRGLGMTLAARGKIDEAQLAYSRSVRIFERLEDFHLSGSARTQIARSALWLGHSAEALAMAGSVLEFAEKLGCERCSLAAERLQGFAAAALGRLEMASECLRKVLDRSRAVKLVREEVYALLGLANLEQTRGNLEAARELLDDVWKIVHDGPYRLLHADALNTLARLECRLNRSAEAIEAARGAYRLSWCDGPPFAYYWGLVAARKLLKELGASDPNMPPFDESRAELLPKLEIDPTDEFEV
jgi:tetratricopeptide (TPR) repeat protein